ncbi:recombinase family protein [Candidatus Saccharibacteria bacterium]|jgi:DNA invertase Pin-like site-specific DNA recombinase|nr:recombinase family protein [Candidatus Saccharibacteria bacterium]
MKALLIARVSSLDQADALPGQIYRLKAYAAKKGYDYELYEINESAWSGKRSYFKQVINKVLETIDEKSRTVIVFDKIDRYTRNSSNTEVNLLNTLCRSGNIELHFPSDNLFLNKDSSAQEHFMLNMGTSTAQYYSDSISDNVKRRNQQKLRDGEWTGKAPIGYINTTKPNGQKWVELDPSTDYIVREAFDMYATGLASYRSIAKRWREKYGLATTHSSRIEQILQNPFYYGEMRVKGKIYAHHYTPLLSRRLYQQAQEQRTGYKVQGRPGGYLPFPYRGLITCSTCGCRITFERKKGKYVYGHCTFKRGKHDSKYVNQDKITEQINKILLQIQIPDNVYKEVSKVLQETSEKNSHTLKQRITTLESEIKKYQTRKERVYEDYLDGKIPEDLYQRKFQEYDSLAKIKQEDLKRFELSDNDHYLSVSHLLKLARDIQKLFLKADIDQKRLLINTIGSNFSLDGDLLRWKYKKPFDLMASCNENLNWLRLQVTEQSQGWQDTR